MQFIIKAYDGRDAEAPARRMAARAEHLENIQKLNGTVICAGGIIEDGHAVGSFLVMEFANQELFDEYLANEPYIRAKVWQDVKVETANVVILNNEMVGN